MTTRNSTGDAPIAWPADAAGAALIPAPNRSLSPYDEQFVNRHPTVGNAEITAPKQRIGRPFAPGTSGNLRGRPPGRRNKLTETLLDIVTKDFATHGAEVLATLRKRDPSTYLRIVSSMLPRALILKQESQVDYAAMTDDEIVELLQQRQRRKAIEAALKATE